MSFINPCSAMQSVKSNSDSCCSDHSSDPSDYNNSAAGEEMLFIQMNGTRTYGPPADWIGPPPSAECELFIKKIPRSFTEYDLLPHFRRFGQIYEFRLMMDYNENNRGFGYVRFTDVEIASKALAILQHLYITPGKFLEIKKSHDKCRLFVGNIPKNLSREVVEHYFRTIFPNMSYLVLHKSLNDQYLNRGFAFVDFPNHQLANKAKMDLTGCNHECVGWGQPLKIVWANPEKSVDSETLGQLKTLFVRNVDLTISPKSLMDFVTRFINRREVVKVSRVRELAFIEFHNRYSAEEAKRYLKGAKLQGNTLDVEWATPPSENSIHNLKQNDFDYLLRFKCVANDWSLPVYVFGRVFGVIQYVAIFIKYSNQDTRAFFMEITTNSPDIQSRAAEVIIKLIEEYGYLPPKNFVLKVDDEFFHIVGAVFDFDTVSFKQANPKCLNSSIMWEEIIQLVIIVSVLSRYPRTELYKLYSMALSEPSQMTYIKNLYIYGRIFGSLPFTYRNTRILPYDMDNSQIILVACDLDSKNNFQFPNIGKHCLFFNEILDNTRYQVNYQMYRILPLHFLYSATKHTQPINNFVAFGEIKPFANGDELNEGTFKLHQ